MKQNSTERKPRQSRRKFRVVEHPPMPSKHTQFEIYQHIKMFLESDGKISLLGGEQNNTGRVMLDSRRVSREPGIFDGINQNENENKRFIK